MKIEAVGMSNYALTGQMDQLKGAAQAESFSDALKNAVDQKDDKALMDACKEVETYMISSLFKQMKQSTESEDPLIPKGDYEKMFESNMVDDMAKNMTEAGGIGLAKMMYEQMSRR